MANFFTAANQCLEDVVKETLKGGFLLIPMDISEYLVEKEWVETNPEIQENGNIAARATDAGIIKAGVEETPKEKIMSEAKFEIEDIPVVKQKKSYTKKSVYPFDQLEVGQSFFVPATAEKPEPWKSMATTVATAIRRHAELVVDEAGEPVMRKITRGPNIGNLVQETKNTKIFVLTEDEKDGVKGARIGRTA